MFYIKDNVLHSDKPLAPQNLEEAFDLSIEAWQTRLQYHLDHPNLDEAISGHSTSFIFPGDAMMCGLCIFFSHGCGDCPIGVGGKHHSCSGTPYNHYHNSNDNDDLIKYAQQEVDMLMKLKSRNTRKRVKKE